jgi:hypothetical protein
VVGLDLSKNTQNDAEKKGLLEFFSKMDKKVLRDVAEVISTMVRAFDGKPVESDDLITRLTNVKNLLERSRFPTYPLLAKQVYLRLIAKYNTQASACEDWADLEAQALISYRGKSREEYTEQLKHAGGARDEQMVYFGSSMQPQVSKKPFLKRQPKPEESEFKAQ